ncbi:hypothetical protein Aco03nite_019890 [Actinoplanes couchii]|uniref:Uncharacterized protein n=1 Tax=Actinoplanes couchii TaxID=403638 RepID=A0ABQ3X4Y6_9ACTN|nr:hypothetical protein Aco03nite_019890 [Actinoplanes couchii]
MSPVPVSANPARLAVGAVGRPVAVVLGLRFGLANQAVRVRVESTDAGRAWHTRVLADAPAAETSLVGIIASMYLPKVVSGAGPGVYVLIYRADDVFDVRYSADGRTWRELRLP